MMGTPLCHEDENNAQIDQAKINRSRRDQCKQSPLRFLHQPIKTSPRRGNYHPSPARLLALRSRPDDLFIPLVKLLYAPAFISVTLPFCRAAKMLRDSTQGLFYGLIAYGIWGFFPLFFSLMRDIDPPQVLMHRVIWSCLFVALLLTLRKAWRPVRQALGNRSILRAMLLSSLLISTNWLIFIYAVSQQQVLSSSLGYFLTPLVSVALALVFLGEKLDRYRAIAIALAAAAIGWQIISLGELPWISLALATTFGIYGLVRKQAPIDTLSGLFVETLILVPVAALYWVWLGQQGSSQFLTRGTDISLLLILSGVVTALPLLAFAAATKRLSLIAVGFMMYINPTLQFLTAVWLFQEPFSQDQLISFSMIWLGLAVFSVGALKNMPRRARLASSRRNST